jgi:hypothetical protein
LPKLRLRNGQDADATATAKAEAEEQVKSHTASFAEAQERIKALAEEGVQAEAKAQAEQDARIRAEEKVTSNFFNDTATTEIYTLVNTLSLHDALPIWTEADEREPETGPRKR